MDVRHSAKTGLWAAASVQTRLLDYLPLVWTALVAGLLFTLLHERGFDDPYITYRYAVNIAEGRGFVYNPGERVLSTTAPLYALILALAHRLGLDVPLTSNALGCASLALGGLAFWHLGQAWQARVAGFAGLVLYPSAPMIVPALGAETALHTTLILFACVAYARERYCWTAGLMAAATLVRADAILAASVLATHFLLSHRAPIPWRAVALYGALLAPWFAFAWAYFGAPLPVTLAAKQRQGAMAVSTGFFAGLWEFIAGYWRYPLYRLHFLFGAIGLVYAAIRARGWLLLLAWNVLYAATYSMLGVSSYFWYYGPLAVGNVALVAPGIQALYHLARSRIDPGIAYGATTLALAALLVPQVNALSFVSRTNDTRLAIYREVGAWLQASTPADASIGTLEVGIIGYHADRRMIDFAGLIQPETALRLTPTTTYEDAARWAVQHFQPDYLVLQEGGFPRLVRDAAVQTKCRALRHFRDAAYPHTLVVHACTW